MTVNELKQMISKGILDLGITPSFTENPSFHKILEDTFGPIIDRLESKEEITPHVRINDNIIHVDDEYSTNSFENSTINKKISFKLKKNTDSSFICIAESLKGLPESVSRKLKEVFEITLRIDQEGNIYVNEAYSAVHDTAKPNSLEGNAICQSTVYDSNGIMVKKEKKTYNGLGYNSDITYVPADELLYVPEKSFDRNSSFFHKYNRCETMIRDAFDVAEISITDNDTFNQYKGFALLDDTEGLSMMIPSSDFKIEEDSTIEPLSEREIKEKLSKETDPQIRMGLYGYSEDRSKYIYQNGQKQVAELHSVRHF